MTPARGRVRSVPPDCEAARARLASAERFAVSADTPGLLPEASFVLLYDAARNALSAVLAAAGLRVVEGRGAHAITIGEAGRLLGAGHQDEIVRIDGARVARNRTEYDAQPVGRAQVTALRRTTGVILDVCSDFVARNCA